MNTISSRWKLQRPGDSGLNEDILPRFEPRFQQDLKDTSIQPSYKYKALYLFSHWVVSLGNRETVGLVVDLCLDKDRLDWIFWNCFAIFQNAQNRITRAVHHKRRLYVPTDRDLYTILKKNRMGLDFVQFISNDLFFSFELTSFVRLSRRTYGSLLLLKIWKKKDTAFGVESSRCLLSLGHIFPLCPTLCYDWTSPGKQLSYGVSWLKFAPQQEMLEKLPKQPRKTDGLFW